MSLQSKMMDAQRQPRSTLPTVCSLISAVGLALCALAVVLPTPSLGGSTYWYRVTLAHGKSTEGYKWAVGAKGRKGHALNEICATLSMVEPPRNDVPYVEGTDSTDCGSVRRPAESVASSVSMGQGESALEVVEILYRPIVRKVNLVLNSGEERVLRAKAPEIRNRVKKGIPAFRFVALPLEDDDCIQRVISYDGKGNVVNNEKTETCA
jgi:hypothetical protein